jgi:hypothetical protein
VGRPQAPGQHGRGVTVPLPVVAAALALAVLALVPLARRDVRHPALALARVLVPSWRFFDAVGAHPELLARVAGADGCFGPWRPVLRAPRRAWWNVAWHPEGNLALARLSLLDRLLADGAAADAAPTSLVSYRLVLDQVRWALAGGEGAALVQFKLAARGPDGGGPADLLVSEVHRL